LFMFHRYRRSSPTAVAGSVADDPAPPRAEIATAADDADAPATAPAATTSAVPAAAAPAPTSAPTLGIGRSSACREEQCRRTDEAKAINAGQC
jgi:hypothetical protein